MFLISSGTIEYLDSFQEIDRLTHNLLLVGQPLNEVFRPIPELFRLGEDLFSEGQDLLYRRDLSLDLFLFLRVELFQKLPSREGSLGG